MSAEHLQTKQMSDQLIRFNELFYRMSEDDKNLEVFEQDLPFFRKETLEAPVFFWEAPEWRDIKEPINDVWDLIETEENCMPFPSFRIGITQRDSTGRILKEQAWIDHRHGFLRACFAQKIKKGKIVIQITSGVSDSYIPGFAGDIPGPDKWGLRVLVDGIPVDYEEYDKKDRETVLALGMNSMYILARFILEYNSGAYFKGSVSPEKKGRSVEWIKARTHFVLIHKKHPANNRSAVKGSKIKESEESIKRMCHTRRAHTRVLKSPFFRHKIGKVIKVKSCWVGPREWRQNNSIYKIVTD